MLVELYCRKCGTKNHFPRNWLEDADACKDCKATDQWSTVPPGSEPEVDYELSANDRRFLRSLRIAPE